MAVDHVVPNSLDDIFGPGAEDALGGTETTYTVRVDGGRVVEMTGMQEDLDEITAAMRATAAESADRFTGIDYVLGAEEHGAVGSLDLLNLLHPETAGVAINEALRKLWPDRIDEREDVFDLARQYMAGCDEVDRNEFFIPFAVDKSRDRPYALAVVRRLTNIIYDMEPK